MMAPWAEGRLRHGRRADEVPVELVGWDAQESPAELATAAGIAEQELDAGCTYGVELVHVWSAEHEADGRKSTLYVVETIGFDQGITDEPW